jgi:hypothetical protein
MDVTGLKCADIVDAMGRLHRHRCQILDLVSPTPGRTLFGPAVTIFYFPSCRSMRCWRRHAKSRLQTRPFAIRSPARGFV